MLRVLLPSRRELLRLGGLFGLGLPLFPQAVRSAAPAPGFGKAKSVIVVYTGGGQSQLDTWDPKPDAPAEIRGEFRSLATAVPGTQFCEHLPGVARLADLFTVVRNLSHDDLDHGTSMYLTLTGMRHTKKSGNPPPQASDFPMLGAALRRVQPRSPFPYSAVTLNGPHLIPINIGPGQFAGHLGKSFEPLQVGDVLGENVAIRGLDPLPELPIVRLQARQSLLESVERASREFANASVRLDQDGLYRQAYELLSTPVCRRAFDLEQEPRGVRERYGMYRSGQACLLARRLVEAGVPMITVMWNHSARGQDKSTSTDEYGWDTHNDVFSALREHLLPRFDQSFSALLEDLHVRGLLASTLVLCMGEFGRAPKIAIEKGFAGESPGRKHWSAVYSIVAAGAGVARGKVSGISDRIAAYPAEVAVGPWDVAATVFHALGVDPGQHYTDTTGREFPLSVGRPIEDWYE